MRNITFTLLLIFIYGCSNKMEPENTKIMIDFVPYSVVCQNNLDPYIILPLLNEPLEYLNIIDSNSYIENTWINLDKDEEKEMLLKFMNPKNRSYHYYFFNWKDQLLQQTARIHYTSGSREENLPPAIDTIHQIIWVNQWMRLAEASGYFTYGLKYNNGKIDTIIKIPGVTFETQFITEPELIAFNGQIHREELIVTDTLIQIKILCNVNKYLTPESIMSINIYSQRFHFDLKLNPSTGKYEYGEKMDHVNWPPIYASDVIKYEEIKNGRKILK